MQQEDRKVQENLSEVLDQALARIRAGESIEACLDDSPQSAPALTPLLRTGALLHDEAATPLPPDLEAWLPSGARDFAAIAQQMLPQQSAHPHQTTTPVRSSKRLRSSAPASLSEILDTVLARVSAGESVETCLADHPQHAVALAPLLRTSMLLQSHATTPPPPELEVWLPHGAREFSAIAEQLAPRYTARRKPAAPRKLSLQRTMATVAIATILMGVAADSASAASLPGETLYQWKRTKEDISLSLTADPDTRSQLHVDYAKRRLNEFKSLVANGDINDEALIADTLNSMLVHTQGAITEAQQGGTINKVKPEIYQFLDQAEGALANAANVAPQTQQMLSNVKNQFNGIEENLPTAVAIVATDQPEESATAIPSPTALPPTEQATIPPSQPTDQAGPPIPGGSAPTDVIGPPPPPPSATPSGGLLPTDAPTAIPSNTPTTDPATAVPPTQVPPTNEPGVPVETPLPTLTPEPTVAPPTATPPPTASPIPPATEGPLPTLPPTPPPRPSRTPPPTDTPSPTDTPPPTNTPTPPPTPPPTNTPTDVPTATDTPVALATNIPTGTPTVASIPGTSDQTSTATVSAAPSTASLADTPTSSVPTPTPLAQTP
jgi:Domain of unknown function (DUF5667)